MLVPDCIVLSLFAFANLLLFCYIFCGALFLVFVLECVVGLLVFLGFCEGLEACLVYAVLEELLALFFCEVCYVVCFFAGHLVSSCLCYVSWGI
jgi:hypothetical protein